MREKCVYVSEKKKKGGGGGEKGWDGLSKLQN